jgi:hypothetical protein
MSDSERGTDGLEKATADPDIDRGGSDLLDSAFDLDFSNSHTYGIPREVSGD